MTGGGIQCPDCGFTLRRDISNAHSGVTRMQGAALDTIANYIVHEGRSPSYLDIAAALNLSGKGQVHWLISALRHRGLVKIVPHRARSVTPTPAGWALYVPKEARHDG